MRGLFMKIAIFLISLTMMTASFAGDLNVPGIDQKIVNLSEYEAQTKAEKRVVVGGCFDVLHIAHVSYLSKSRALGDRLIVMLEPDSRITKYKKRKPVHTQQQRARILASLSFVDQVIMLPELSSFDEYLAVVKKVKPSFIAVTGGDPQLKNLQKQAKAVGAKVVTVIKLVKPHSSTRIVTGQASQ